MLKQIALDKEGAQGALNEDRENALHLIVELMINQMALTAEIPVPQAWLVPAKIKTFGKGKHAKPFLQKPEKYEKVLLA